MNRGGWLALVLVLLVGGGAGMAATLTVDPGGNLVTPTNFLGTNLLPGVGVVFTNKGGGKLEISATATGAGGLPGGASAGQVLVAHPITGALEYGGGEFAWVHEPFKNYVSSSWGGELPYTAGGSYGVRWTPLDLAPSYRRGFFWLTLSNWPGRTAYVFWGNAGSSGNSGLGSIQLRTNTWLDCSLTLEHRGSATALTNLEMIVGLVDQPNLSAGSSPRDGVFFMRRPAGTGPLVDWAAVVRKANATVSSNRLGWASVSNEWSRLTIAGSSNAVVFYTNGVAAITNAGLAFQTNYFHLVVYGRVVVTNTTFTFATNSAFVDYMLMKE